VEKANPRGVELWGRFDVRNFLVGPEKKVRGHAKQRPPRIIEKETRQLREVVIVMKRPKKRERGARKLIRQFRAFCLLGESREENA